MKTEQARALNATPATFVAILFFAVPVNAGTMIFADGYITVDEDNLAATSNHSAVIEDIEPVHVFENWSLQGKLEHPAGTVVGFCNDSGVAGITTQLECTAHKMYTDCTAAFGAQRGRTNSQIFISENSTNNINTTKRLATRHLECSASCFADKTNTEIFPLDGASSHIPHTIDRLDYTLTRTRVFDRERFVMDEWTVTSSGGNNWATAPSSSSDRFRDAVAAQFGHDLPGSHLVIQEPVHERNSRWIPLPEIRIVDTSLPAGRRGSGEVVAVRAEIFKDQHVEDLQVVHASSPVDEIWIGDLLRERLSLKFSSPRQHPTVAFLVFRIGQQIEVVSSRSVLPGCCGCIGEPCP